MTEPGWKREERWKKREQEWKGKEREGRQNVEGKVKGEWGKDGMNARVQSREEERGRGKIRRGIVTKNGRENGDEKAWMAEER